MLAIPPGHRINARLPSPCLTMGYTTTSGSYILTKQEYSVLPQKSGSSFHTTVRKHKDQNIQKDTTPHAADAAPRHR